MQRVPRAAPSAALGGPVAPGIGARQAARQRPGARPAVRWRHVGGAPVKVPRHGLPEERAVAALHQPPAATDGAAHAVAQMVARVAPIGLDARLAEQRSEEHTSELQSLMRISYAVLCLKKKQQTNTQLKRA